MDYLVPDYWKSQDEIVDNSGRKSLKSRCFMYYNNRKRTQSEFLQYHA